MNKDLYIYIFLYGSDEATAPAEGHTMADEDKLRFNIKHNT